MKICKRCGNINNYHAKGLCKSCYFKEWRKNNKEYDKKRKQKWQKEKPEKSRKIMRRYRKRHPEKYKEWSKTKKGKESIARREAKRNRNFGWFKLYENPFQKNEEIEWHHYNDEFVIALPKDLHRLYLGKNHRENTKYIINQIYFSV